MFFPISDTPNPAARPYVTWALILVNVAVFLVISLPATRQHVNLQDPELLAYLRSLGVQGSVNVREILTHVSAYDLLVYKYGFKPGRFSWADILTSLFLHGGLLHLAGNMLFLYIFGDNVENRLGRWRFLLVYLLCGVCACLFFAFFAATPEVPLIGASGAIFGVLGCYFLWFPRNRVRCFLLFFLIYLPARLVLAFYLVIDNILPFLLSAGAADGVAHGAHIGGFFAGLAIAAGADQCYRFRFGGRQARSEAAAMSSVLEPFCPGCSAGDLSDLAECYLTIDKNQRMAVAAEDVLTIGNHLLDAGRPLDALRVFRRFISERQNDPGLDRAYLGAGKSMLYNPRLLTSAYHYFLSALDLAQSAPVAAEARDYLRRIEAHQAVVAKRGG